jgi:Protein of unknown function (DUF1360)
MEISLLDFTILALASFRLTRLIVFDKITEFIRNPFFDEIEEVNEDGLMEVYYFPKQTPIKKFLGELLSCYWCTGIWVSAALVLGYIFFSSFFEIFILVFAVAGFASLLESLVHLWIDN